MHSPLQSHFEAAYIKSFKMKSLDAPLLLQTWFADEEVKPLKKQTKPKSVIRSVEAYDLAKCKMTIRSVSDYCVYVSGCLVYWKWKKQSTLSRSSTEAKYRSMALATREVMWIVKILKDLNVQNVVLVSLVCDNSSAIQIAVS
ncbi:hypothetical protein Tco_0772943 [Tanacetum coccineum]|uniref:Uncharacterized protein n=1 Tax=Tanacetum coccineum TaxID=301880 RepID=A0ABQ4ZMA6_9ASTR